MALADATLPLQAAVVAALRAAPGVAAEVAGRVYDRPPQAVTFPYVSLGPSLGEPFEAQDVAGWSCVLTVDTWSRAYGAAECRRIMAAVHAALHDAALSVTGHQFVMGRLLDARTLEEDLGATVHGVSRFEFVTHI